jgi:hypothetical protein
MSFDNPFECPGQWLKGNLHTHTTLSDGCLSPQQRISAYAAKGYDFLALTDHDRLADIESVSSNRLILIRGIEVGCDNPTGGPSYHIVGLGLPASFQTPATRHVQTVVDAINAAGGRAIIAHPYWCGQSIKDLEVVADALGVEVFNATCLRGIGKGTSAVQWNDLLSQGKTALGFAVDDVHAETRDAFQGWVMAKCESRTREGVMDALVRGRFYATCGPTLESLAVDGLRIRVRTSPAAYISFIADGPRGGHVFREDGAPVTEGEYTARNGERFVRVECTDQAGRTAWSNPVFFK